MSTICKLNPLVVRVARSARKDNLRHLRRAATVFMQAGNFTAAAKVATVRDVLTDVSKSPSMTGAVKHEAFQFWNRWLSKELGVAA